MQAHGYAKKSRSETPTELKEVTLTLTIEEMDLVIEFFQAVRARQFELKDKPAYWHLHFQDWLKKPGFKPDIIIVNAGGGQ